MWIKSEHRDLDFSYTKENTILRRLERRRQHQPHGHTRAVREFLAESEKEQSILYRETADWRHAFSVTPTHSGFAGRTGLSHHLPPEKRIVRIWSTGCSTGEEILAGHALPRKYMDQHRFEGRSQDLCHRHRPPVAGECRSGLLLDSMVADITPTRLSHFFSWRERLPGQRQPAQDGGLYPPTTSATHPFQMDLIVCRNLFIYLKPEMQNHIPLGLLSYARTGRSSPHGQQREHRRIARRIPYGRYQAEARDGRSPAPTRRCSSALPMLRSGRSPAMGFRAAAY